ncbi:MAG: hypothetical protein RLZZ15_1975 [Verrucomicrobiota bacterium]|jgi:signal transduction histidine kinase/CheY-like chemotaxis protein
MKGETRRRAIFPRAVAHAVAHAVAAAARRPYASVRKACAVRAVDAARGAACVRGVPVSLPRRATRRLAVAGAAAFALWAGGVESGARAAEGDEAGRPVFRNFRPTEYRGHPQVYGVATTPGGLVYLTSEQGLTEYDGQRWRHLWAPGSMGFAVAADAAGRVWLGGMDEVGYFAAATPGGEQRYHSVNDAIPAAERPFGRTRSLLMHGGAVYFSARGKIFRWREGAVRSWKIGTRAARLVAVGEALFAHALGVGLLRLEGDEWRPVSAAPALVKSNDTALLPHGPGRLLAAISGDAFYEIDLATGALTPWATPAAALVRTAQSITGVRLRDGSLALGVQPLGLLLVSADGARVRRLDRTTGLVDNTVLSLAEDPAGGLWVGFNTGAARVELDSPVSVFDGDNGPPSGTIDCWGRHEGVLFAGAFDGLWRLAPADAATGAGARFVKDPRPLGNVFAIEAFEGETLVAAGGGLHALKGETHTRLVDTLSNSPLCLVPSRVRRERFYLGGLQGLTVVEKTAAGWVKLAEFLELGDVHTAAEEADGTLWLATYSRGFWRIPRAGDVTDWKNVQPTQVFKNAGLPDPIAWTSVFDAPGGASLFTDQGSYRFDAASGRCAPDARYALPGEKRTAVYPLVRAANGDEWASVYTDTTLETNFPIGRFVRAGTAGAPAWRPAPAAALAEIGFAGAALMALDRTPAGEEVVWARGYNNTVRLVLGRAAPAGPAWRALVRGVQAGGRAQPLPSAGTALHLAYSREPITFALAAPNFGGGGEARFSTRLVGYSARWSEPAATPDVAFTNLSGGPFTLEVRAHNAEGRVSEIAALRFTVAPPWHRAPLAYALYALALGAGIFGYVRWRLGRGERERARLEALVAERTRDLATARDAAEGASRAKSAFLAAMSHELRTPLNGVIGYAQLLQTDARLAPDQRERLRIVHQSGEHLLHMINDVLDLAKIEAGKIELRPAPFALAEMIHDVAAAHQSAAAGKRLAFGLKLAADLPAWVEGDAQKLRQVLDNVLGNAVKFTARGGVVLRVAVSESRVASATVEARAQGAELRAKSPELRARTDGEQDQSAPESTSALRGSGSQLSALSYQLLTFSVSDTGPGIAPADRARLFRPFEQAGVTRPAAPGTGLGLAISRALVERMGGTLAVESEPGAGSVFSFSVALPARAAPMLAAARPDVTGYEGARRRVLIVDDHAVNRSLLTDLLGPLGFACGEAVSGEAALATLASGDEPWPDLAIVDLRMEGIDGLELTRRLRALPRGGELRVLLTSASVLSFDFSAARAAGCDEFLPKPFRTADLVEKIGALLALRWHEAAAENPRGAGASDPAGAAAALAPIPAAARAALREVLAQGDLEAFRAALARVRGEHPGAAARWAELDEAAAGFQLSRLRALLDAP